MLRKIFKRYFLKQEENDYKKTKNKKEGILKGNKKNSTKILQRRGEKTPPK